MMEPRNNNYVTSAKYCKKKVLFLKIHISHKFVIKFLFTEEIRLIFTYYVIPMMYFAF